MVKLNLARYYLLDTANGNSLEAVMGSAPQLKPYHFKKGDSGNPKGRPPLPPELKAISPFTASELSRIISKYGRLTKGVLYEVLENPATPVMDLSVCKLFEKCLVEGDYARLNFLLDRCIGKPPVAEPLDSDGNDLSAVPTAELLQLIKRAIPDIKNQIESSPDLSASNE